MSAPSAGNEQPWRFVVIDDRQILSRVTAFHPYAAMLHEAPVAILVCGDLHLERFRGYWMQDCSAAVQNILVAARAKGLGSVWLGLHPVEERTKGIQELLGLPAHIVPLALVPVGHPAEEKGRAERFDAGRVHRNRWAGVSSQP
jgi:nitroreductase